MFSKIQQNRVVYQQILQLYCWMYNMALRRQRASFAPAELEGCCIRHCLVKPEPIRKPNRKEIEQEREKRSKRRRLSLYSVSSMNDESEDEESGRFTDVRGFREERRDSEMKGDRGEMFEKRRGSMMVVRNERGKENQSKDMRGGGKKGLKVMLAEKLTSAPQVKECLTPFRVNVQRPSSTLDYYDNEDESFRRRAHRQDNPLTTLRQHLLINQPSFHHSIMSNNSNPSKRASTPSQHPTFPSNSPFSNPISSQTPYAKLSTFDSIPESLRALKSKPLTNPNNPKQNKFIIQIPYLIQDLSEIVDRKNASQSIAESKMNDTIMGTSRFPNQFDKKSLNQTKRPQQRIRMLEEYFQRGGYRGSGRIASVYIVQEKELGCLYASKEVFKKTVYEKDMTLQMEREIASHYMLPNHENIVPLYQVFEDSQRYYFILELGECNLRNLMGAVMSESLCKKYLKDILNGLGFLHQNGIIHRHLKPQNIIMSHDSCKITDFGWAPKLLYMNNHSEIPEYCSPQVMKQEPYNHKTDLWSVGIIAYQMLTGIRPFNGLTQDYTLDLADALISKAMKKLILRLVDPTQDKRATIPQALRLLEF